MIFIYLNSGQLPASKTTIGSLLVGSTFYDGPEINDRTRSPILGSLTDLLEAGVY
ncbi:uncharacterized protein METZ01_LOCUS228966 [marine metagenome]|uniref:Uncharacterized protein n=1 Tax=marine metagenome TaxID=408172 RepID=A0A382GMI5_9ZZZZ